jgi:hypothetical protein
VSTISQQLVGRTIGAVYRNGACLLIKCTDGFDITIGWKDPDTGAPIKGEPVIVNAGKQIIARAAPVVHRREVGL